MAALGGGALAASTSPAINLPSNDEYCRNAPNDPRKGFNFQEEFAFQAVLILNDNQELAFEVRIDKIDDLVMKLTDAKKQEETFYFKQYKRIENVLKTVEWRNLSEELFKGFVTAKNDLAKTLSTSSLTKRIGEISLTTNIGLSQADEAQYFDKIKTNAHWSSFAYNFSNRPPERFHLNINGRSEIKTCLLSSKTLKATLNDINGFLDVLVFDVHQPDINDLMKINTSLVKIYYPFHSNFYEEVKLKILEFFDAKRNIQVNTGIRYFTKWTTTSMRHGAFDELIPSLKEKSSLGSMPGYEMTRLSRLFLNLELEHVNINILREKSSWFHTLEKFLKNSFPGVSQQQKDEESKVIKIFSFNTTMTSLKAYTLLKITSLLNRSLIVKVESKVDSENVENYFKELSKELFPFKEINRKRCCFLVEIDAFSDSQLNQKKDDIASRLVNFFSNRDLKDLRKWIQFAVINNYSRAEMAAWENDKLLEWDDLPNSAKCFLFQKTLKIANVRTSSLQQFKFEENKVNEWILPEALAELVTQEEDYELPFPAPTFNEELDSMYIKRKVKLPCINQENIGQELVQRVCSREGDDGALIWSRDGVSFEDISQFIVPSTHSLVEREETFLLQNKVLFGSGRDNRLAIVVDYPGKGKTSLLTNLSNLYIKNPTRNGLLFRVNLREVRFKDFKSSDQNRAVDFLVENLLLSNKPQQCPLVSAILKRLCVDQLSSSSVFLLLDGVDEIISRNREITFEMIEKLLKQAHGIRRIILASRPDNDLTPILQNRFKRFVLHLKDFDEDDQIHFIEQQWRKKLKIIVETDQSELRRIRLFAEELIRNSDKFLEDKDRTFLGVPLQCFIFSEVLFEDLETYLKDNTFPTALFGRGYTLLELYNKFFEAKLNILQREKAKMSFEDNDNAAASLIRTFIRDATSTALKTLAMIHLRSADAAEIVCQKTWKVYRNHMLIKDLEIGIKLGFLKEMKVLQQESDENDPDIRFIHRTFAEYFAALFFFDNINQTSETMDGASPHQDAIFDNLIEIVCLDKGIKRFLERMFFSYKVVDGERRRLAFIDDRKLIAPLEKGPLFAHERFITYMKMVLFSQEEIADIGKREKFFLYLTLDPLVDTENSWMLLCLKSRTAKEDPVYPLLDVFQYLRKFDAYSSERKTEEYRKIADNFVAICSELLGLSGRNEHGYLAERPIQGMKPILKLLMPSNVNVIKYLFGKKCNNLNRPQNFYVFCGLAMMHELKNIAKKHDLSHGEFSQAFYPNSSKKMQRFHSIALHSKVQQRNFKFHHYESLVQKNDTKKTVRKFVDTLFDKIDENQTSSYENNPALFSLLRFIFTEAVINCWHDLSEFQWSPNDA